MTDHLFRENTTYKAGFPATVFSKQYTKKKKNWGVAVSWTRLFVLREYAIM